MRSSHRFFFPGLAAALGLAALAAAASPAAAALRYEAVTTVAAEKQNQTTRVEAWIDGAAARIEFRDGANPLAPAGTYVVTRDGGETLYFVDPKEETYAEWELDAMLSTLGGMIQSLGPVLKFEVSNVEVEKLAEEPGEPLHGLATTHVRYRTRYDMKVRVLGIGQESRVERLQDLWVTDALPDPAMGVWLRNRPAATGEPGLDQLLAAEMGKVSGLPLKSVEVTTTTGKKGKRESETRTTMEVVALERGVDVAASRFEVPPGYRQTQMLPTGGAAGSEGEGEEESNPFKRIFGGG